MIYSIEAGRHLKQDEFDRLKFHFNEDSLSEMRFLGECGIPIKDNKDPLCNKFKCATKVINNVYFSNGTINIEKTNYLDSLQDENETSIICSNANTYCQKEENLIATYNCIGFSFGISLWVPSNLMKNCITKSQCKSSIKSLVETLKDIDREDSANFDDILHKKMQLIDVLSETPKNNTIALILKGGSLIHASRYVTSIKQLEINQWVSKFGGDILISHELKPVIKTYGGDEVYYIGVIEVNEPDL